MTGPARLCDSGKGCYTGERLFGGLLDYQEDAVKHCIESLKQRKVAVVGLGSGLGKKRVAREILIRVGACERGALVFCPSGLVSQTAKSYQCKELTVSAVKTSKQLIAAVETTSSVLIINSALQWEPKNLAGRGFLVIGEAHTLSPSIAASCMASAPGAPMILLSSEPHLLSDYFADQIHIIDKYVNPQTRRLRMEALWSTAFSLAKTPELTIAVGAALPLCIFRRFPAPTPVGYTDHLSHLSVDELHLKKKEVGGCSCCGLRQSTLWELHKKHQIACSAINLVCPPWSGPPIQGEVRVVLALFESRRKFLTSVRDFPPDDTVHIIKLTSTRSFSMRTRALADISNFRLQIATFTRAKGPFAEVLRIGHGWFISECWKLLFPRLTVLVPDKNCDVGYDMYRALDAIWIPHPPSGPDRLNHIVGMVSRANTAVARKTKYIKVVMDVWEDTLDELFAKHCAATLSNISCNRHQTG
jgi:hypothetical protein